MLHIQFSIARRHKLKGTFSAFLFRTEWMEQPDSVEVQAQLERAFPPSDFKITIYERKTIHHFRDLLGQPV